MHCTEFVKRLPRANLSQLKKFPSDFLDPLDSFFALS
jgi:hypothetical protein